DPNYKCSRLGSYVGSNQILRTSSPAEMATSGMSFRLLCNPTEEHAGKKQNWKTNPARALREEDAVCQARETRGKNTPARTAATACTYAVLLLIAFKEAVLNVTAQDQYSSRHQS